MMRVVSVNTGVARDVDIDGRLTRSAIGKTPTEGRVALRALGLEGDEQADLSVHGGLSQAVYAYPSEHFAFWQTVRAQARVTLWDEALAPGAVGENFTLAGLLENQVWVGDVLRFPQCSLAVSSPRQPCFKFNAAMGFAQAGKLMAQAGYCGFYLAVREEGSIAAGEAFELLPGPREVSIPELFRSQMARHR
jgi:MOSC domain-containing protein YiiM